MTTVQGGSKQGREESAGQSENLRQGVCTLFGLHSLDVGFLAARAAVADLLGSRLAN